MIPFRLTQENVKIYIVPNLYGNEILTMNKMSPLDIRIAVLAYPLVSRDEMGSSAFAHRPIAAYSGDERIVSLFQNSPKPRIEQSKSKVPPLFRKGQYALIRVLEILKTILEIKEPSKVLSDIAPPRRLLVPELPHPPFRAVKPPRFFWHPAYTAPKDEYAPSCLMSEAKEDLPYYRLQLPCPLRLCAQRSSSTRNP